MEYYAFKGPNDLTAYCAIELFDEENHRWLCKYYLDKVNTRLWYALSEYNWKIDYELTEEEFYLMLSARRERNYEVSSF